MKKGNEGPYRLAHGGLVDRAREVPFRFNGRSYVGYGGDSLASALLATGPRTVARSFKFHRPRGIFSCGIEEPNALLELGGRSSVRATMVELETDIESRSQSGWPSVGLDLGRVLDLFAPLWAAGFYNKTFIWPNWHTYEPLIRRMAGLGRAPSRPDPSRYEVCNLHCDVLIVGGGIAGLKAALEAGRTGSRVVLAEQDRQFGGEASWDGTSIYGIAAHKWVSQTLEELRRMPRVRLQLQTTAVGYYDHQVLTLLERAQSTTKGSVRERYWVVRTGRVVLATGAIEQPMVFANNDRPGIMLAGAVRQYLGRYGVVAGSRILIATNNDSGYVLARQLKEAHATLVGVADSRSEVPVELRRAMHELSIDLFAGSIPIDTRGYCALREVILGRVSTDASQLIDTRSLRCDVLAISGGFNPNLHLYAQGGGKLSYHESSGSLQPVEQRQDVEIWGAAAEKSVIGPRVSPVGNPGRQWVDLLHDVTVADLALALREGYTSIEHVKRYTTVGMAADQGKTSTVCTLDVLARLQRTTSPQLGYTTLRPPFTPVPLGAIAGRDIGKRFAPHRLLPQHAWHVAHGALMEDFGAWRRPVVYIRKDETRQQAIRREIHAVRSAAGLYDGSSLGKIEIHGPDALAFLDHFYINDLTSLKAGRVRYGLMLRENGTIFDDGTVTMLAPDLYLITTTSANADRVGLWLEEWRQCEWPQLRVAIFSVTEAWATVSIAGPKARSILAMLQMDVNLDTGAFPHLAMRQGTFVGAPARIYRVSFTGELTYEINVPTSRGQALWDELLRLGTEDGLQPFGLDALMAMRLEKGYLHVGADTDGTTIPDDVGWGTVAARKRRDYIGQRSLALREHLRRDRMQLIGIAGDREPIAVGTHLRFDDARSPTDGWITSAASCSESGRPLALGLLRSGRTKVGEDVGLYDDGVMVGHGRVVDLPFFDRGGIRLNA